MNGKMKTLGARVWANKGKIVVAGVAAAMVFSSGGAVAAEVLGPNTVGTTQIQAGGVQYPDLGANSVASSRIQDGGVAWGDLAKDSVSGYKVKDGTIAKADLTADVQEQLNKVGEKGEQGEKGEKGEPGDPASDENGSSVLAAVYNDVVVENIGGKFLERKTDLGSFKLPAGTWVINTSAKFQRTVTDETDPLYLTRPQLSVRAFPTEANPFGQDFGTVMNTIAPYATADMFGSDSKRVELTEETTFTVAAFGYQDNRGADDSGKIKLVNATIFVTAG